MTDVTRILELVEAGKPQTQQALLEAVYQEQRQMASAQLAREKPGQTLQPTALVHDAYLRFAGNQRFANRRHFFATAGEAMKRVLDNARRKLSLKLGGPTQRVDLSRVAASDEDERLVALDEQLTQFAIGNPMVPRLSNCTILWACPYGQVAEVLDTIVYEVRQKWAFARSWLKVALDNS